MSKISVIFAILVAILFQTTQGNIIEMDNFRLPEMLLVKKADFAYDDVEGGRAAVSFDMSVLPQRTRSNQTYSLTAIAADSDTSLEIVRRLSNGT